MSEKSDEQKKLGLDNVGDGIDQLLEKATTRITNEVSSAVATQSEIEQVVNSIIAQKKLPATQDSFNKVLLTTSHLVQIGATSPK